MMSGMDAELTLVSDNAASVTCVCGWQVEIPVPVQAVDLHDWQRHAAVHGGGTLKVGVTIHNVQAATEDGTE